MRKDMSHTFLKDCYLLDYESKNLSYILALSSVTETGALVEPLIDVKDFEIRESLEKIIDKVKVNKVIKVPEVKQEVKQEVVGTEQRTSKTNTNSIEVKFL